MPIISVEIMKTINEGEMKKTAKEKQRQEGARGTEAFFLVINFVNSVRLFRQQVLLIITLPVEFVIFSHL